jgi:hypothetical protein
MLVGPAALSRTRVHGAGAAAAVAGEAASVFLTLHDAHGHRLALPDAYRAAAPSLSARVVSQADVTQAVEVTLNVLQTQWEAGADNTLEPMMLVGQYIATVAGFYDLQVGQTKTAH